MMLVLKSFDTGTMNIVGHSRSSDLEEPATNIQKLWRVRRGTAGSCIVVPLVMVKKFC
jgi:hypothetical protein